ncbi:MAG: hypothetical protein LW710_00145 [Burkholderiales bacterium]|jgi:hypothetical protein|uniref:hypothetical protein n=1 Tax=Limnobacter sp. TaxID=2003368 RepID=UPI003961A2E4|nr:hypothetical protein [Burkholderiales bacterium]
MAESTGVTGGATEAPQGEDVGSSADAMVSKLLDAANAVREMGLAMSIAGYQAQAASKHP